MTYSASTTASIVAVDGPAAAGKTTTAVILAGQYGLRYLESGRAYRLVAYLALRHDVSLDSESDLIDLFVHHLGASTAQRNFFEESAGHGEALRSREVDQAVSKVAARPRLRSEITSLIRSWAEYGRGSCIEGRDIGTTVFPAARVKFFLTASPQVRARRRVAERPNAVYEDVLADVVLRDQADERRTVSPLAPAPDAILIDTSHLTVGDVVARMTEHCTGAGLARVPERDQHGTLSP